MSTYKRDLPVQIRQQADPVQIQSLAKVIASLRAPDGCPWDRAQTHASLTRYAIEEAYELADAVEDGDDEALREELGDLLLQVLLHAQIAAEEGRFTLQDVIDTLQDKMIRRHPHVFGDAQAADASEVETRWAEVKKEEGRSTLGGVPRAMPPLERGRKMGERAARVGFDFPSWRDAFAKLDEELEELREAAVNRLGAQALEEELGDVLFSTVNLARKLTLDPSRALSATLEKFRRRFSHIEETLAAAGESLQEAGLEKLDALWDQAKERGL